jgi:hypothetical protein
MKPEGIAAMIRQNTLLILKHVMGIGAEPEIVSVVNPELMK